MVRQARPTAVQRLSLRVRVQALAAALVATACAGCTLPGVETTPPPTVVRNHSSAEATIYRLDPQDGTRRAQLTEQPRKSLLISIGPECSDDWWVQPAGADPIPLGEVCPGDILVLTNDGLER